MVELTGREMKRTTPTTLQLSRSGAVICDVVVYWLNS